MQKAYFFRDIKDIDELQIRTLNAIENHATPIPYNVGSTIELSNEDFKSFSSQFLREHLIFSNYREKMVADKMGVWNCVVVRNMETTEEIAVYYGGFKYPRFVGIV